MDIKQAEDAAKAEQRKKAVLGSKAKKSLRLLVEQHKKKQARPTATRKRKFEFSEEETCSEEEEEAEEEEEESEPTTSSDNEPATPIQVTKDSLKWWWVPCQEEEQTKVRKKRWKVYRGCIVRDCHRTHVTTPPETLRLTTEDRKNILFWMPADWEGATGGAMVTSSPRSNTMDAGVLP